MQNRSLLAVFAHPDDESFGTGGTLAHYAASGVRVTLVCATRGEVGEISDPALATPETLGMVREAELRAAARALGISEILFLGYRDSGMSGTPENGHIDAFINVPAEQVIVQLTGIIRRVQPHVVVTFEPNGGYGHPDHIAIHRHTVAAFSAAAVSSRYPEEGAPWQPNRLYYTAIPRSFFLEMRDRMVDLGIDISAFPRLTGDIIGWPDEQVHAVLDVSHTVDAKWAALNCHRTQFGPDNLFRRLPEALTRQMMSREYFAQAYPAAEPGRVIDDLFIGL